MSVGVIGITGTRDGMTSEQKSVVHTVLSYYFDASTFLSGMCIGTDAQSSKMASGMGMIVEGYPGHSKSNPDDLTCRDRAVENYDEIRESKPYYDRNRDIVDDSDLMIACPNGKNYHGGKGGANYTIRYALKVGKPIVIIFPDGETEKHNIDENIQN